MTNFEMVKWDTGETCDACGASITLLSGDAGAEVECDCGRAEAA